MSKRPNILFFFSDQQRWDTVNETVTPNLAALSEDGVSFENSFTCQPVCGPARACLQTGVYATQNGCYVNAVPLRTQDRTIAHYLNDAGYETAYVGKWHLASGMLGKAPHYETSAIPEERRGGYKDYWRAADVLEFTSDGRGGYVFDDKGNKIEFEGVRADRITDMAIDYIERKESDKPFFLFLSHIEPHHQNSSGRFECPEGAAAKFADYPIPEDLTGLKGNYRDNYADYLACCERLDYDLGRLIDALKKKGIYEDTVIIYTSDHGCHFKTRNFEYKRSCHDGSIRTPLVIRGGAFRGGARTDKLISLIDLPATILDVAGVPIPDYFEGKSIISVLGGGKVRDNVFVQISESQVGRTIRTPRYTYSVRGRGNGFLRKSAKVYYDDFLYDNELDKGQKGNLVADAAYADVKEDLRRTLLDNIERVEGYVPKLRKKRFLRFCK